MNIGLIILLILFIAFILLLVFNPNLSCFGKRIRSPFYPLYRRRHSGLKPRKDLPTTDYGFSLIEGEKGQGEAPSHEKPLTKDPVKLKKPPKSEDYGFKLD